MRSFLVLGLPSVSTSWFLVSVKKKDRIKLLGSMLEEKIVLNGRLMARISYMYTGKVRYRER